MTSCIPLEVAQVALDLAQRHERGHITRGSARDQLMNLHGLKERTANAYLDCYVHLRRGTPMKATISAEGLALMIDAIAALGDDALLIALQALQRQINYLEGLPNSKSKERSLSRVHQRFSIQLAASAQIALPAEDFEAQVERSLADTADARRDRLSKAGKRPRHLLVLTRSFARDPDVVAEVLVRANGTCEACDESAPFLRKSNHTPYLEVHHVVQLAHDGDDTVENALALCPNCHRERHFGLEENTGGRDDQGMSVLRVATAIVGDLAKAISWYQGEPISALGGITAEQLVAAGEADRVKRYLRTLQPGKHHESWMKRFV